MAISVDVILTAVINNLDLLGDKVLPNTVRSVRIAASFVQRTWVNFAQGGDTSGKPAGVNFSGDVEYANSIKIKSVNPFQHEITSNSKIGERLTNGTKKYDMKPALTSGPKSRISKSGDRYNIIPLKHKSSKLKTVKIGKSTAYNMAKSLTQQTIVGTKIDTEGKKRFAYAKWTQDKILSGGSIPKKIQGMVRMKSGSGSFYLTFRTVTLSQTGKWIRKAVPPWDILGEVKKKTEGKVNEIISNGIKQDFNI